MRTTIEVDQEGGTEMTGDPEGAIDTTKPANLRLTRQQKQVLAYVRENQGATIPDVAHAVGCRPYYAMRALEALEGFRWVAVREKVGSCYGWRWELSEQALKEATP